MICSLNEVKLLVSISDNANDTYIKSLMPVLEGLICNYCNNDFINTNESIMLSSGFVFSSTDNSVSLSNIGIGLQQGDTVRFYGSKRNNKAFTIKTVSTDKLTMEEIDIIKDELAGNYIRMEIVEYPTALTLIMANMIKFNLEDYSIGVDEEKIDDYTIKFSTANNISVYPQSIIGGLNIFRRMWRKCRSTNII